MMMSIHAAGAAEGNWPAAGRGQVNGVSAADTEIQKLTEEIEKEESELMRLTREFSEYISDGSQDMAKLRGAEMAQKQMQIQALQLQVSKLEKPEGGEASGSGEAQFDRYIKSDGQPEQTPGIYRVETDENGGRNIVFDSPAAGKAAAGEGAGRKEPDGGGDGEKPVEVGKSVGDDSAWQAEIAKLKQRKAELSQQVGGAGDDEEKRKSLEAKLAEVEAELASKDTDFYRKSRVVVRYLGSAMTDAGEAAKYQ